MYLAGEAPLPHEYAFMPLDDLRRDAARRRGERVLLALDCANESRHRPRPRAARAARRSSSTSTTTTTTRASATSTSSSPTRRRPARSCATSSRELGVELTPEIAEALYIALVTDTGPLPVHEHDAEGAAARRRARRGGRRRPPRLPGRLRERRVREAEAARARARPGAGLRGRPARRLVPRCASDFAEVGAAEPFSEGIIDYLRAVEGADLAALIREPPRARRPDAAGQPARDARTSSTSRRSRAQSGGGGHRQAAGSRASDSIEEITEFIRREFAARLGTGRKRRARAQRARPRRQAGRALVVRGRRGSCASGPARGPGTRARSTRSRPGCCSSCSGARRGSRSASSASTSAT